MARKIKGLTPSAIDALSKGCIPDSLTPELSIAVLASGKKVWKYYRRLPGGDGFLRHTLGQFPAHSIADARTRARSFNEQIETDDASDGGQCFAFATVAISRPELRVLGIVLLDAIDTRTRRERTSV